MQEERLKILDLPLAGDHSGFSVGQFRYDNGFALTTDGDQAFDISFRHRHPHFEIFWIRSGTGLIARDCELIEVRPKSLLILGPGDVHNWKETKSLEGSLLAVSETFTSDSNFSLPFRQLTAFLQPNSARLIDLNANEDNLIRNIFEILRDSDSQSNFDQKEVLKALLLILFSKINGFYVGRGRVPIEATANPLTAEFKRALLTECPPLVSVKEFSEYLKVSRSYLHRTVLNDTGCSPSDLIRDRIIFEAKRLLLHTTGSSSEIAKHLGFRSAGYFSRFFERHTELRPKAFRSSRPA